MSVIFYITAWRSEPCKHTDEKAMDCAKALKELREQQREIAAQKVQNIIDAYTVRIDTSQAKVEQVEAQRKLDKATGVAETAATPEYYKSGKKKGKFKEWSYKGTTYQSEIRQEKTSLKLLRTERKKVNKELQKQMNDGLIVKGDENYNKFMKTLNDLDKKIIDTQTSIAELRKQAQELGAIQIGYKADEYQNNISKINDDMSLSVAAGTKSIDSMKKSYQSLIDNITNQNDTLRDQNKIYLAMRKGLDPMSEEYQELTKLINDNNAAIRKGKADIQNYTDAINNLPLEKLGYQFDNIRNITSAESFDIDVKNAEGQEVTKSDYNDVIRSTKNERENLIKQRDVVQKQLDGIKNKKSAKYYKTLSQLQSIDAQIAQSDLDLFQLRQERDLLPAQKYDWKAGGNQREIDTTQRLIDERQAQGQAITESDYNSMIDSGKNRIDNLKKQREEYVKAQNGMDKYSQAWQDFQSKIDSIDSTISSTTVSIAGWNDEINNLTLDDYSHSLEELKANEEEYSDTLSEKTAKGIRIVNKDYQDLIDTGNSQIENLKNQKTFYEGLMQALVDTYGETAKSSDKYREYEKQVWSLDNSIRDITASTVDWNKEMNNIDVTELGWELDALASSADRLNDAMSLHEAQGITETEMSYKDLIDNGMEQINNLKAQNKEYKKLQEGMDPMSDAYQELQGKINSNLSTINRIKVSQEEWNDAIIDLGINHIQKYRDALAKTNDEYEKQKELQEAIQELEKATYQRKVRTYIEGEGFVYQANEDDIRNAQEKLEDVISNQLLDKLDELIDAIEYSKDSSNVYDKDGRLIGTQYHLPALDSMDEVLKAYNNSNKPIIDINELAYTLGPYFTGFPGEKQFNLSIGDIVLNDVQNGNDLANAIINQFPNALMQALYKK